MGVINSNRTAERRRQILDAALVCFQENGFHGTAMSTICEKAGMSPGHLYHYFSSKVDLIEAIAEEDSQIAERNIAALVKKGHVVEELVRGMERVWKRGQGIHGALNAEVLAEAARNERVSKIIRQRNGRIRSLLAKTLEEAQERGEVAPDMDPLGTASLLIAMTDGLSAAHDAHTGIDLKRATAATRRFLERSLRPDHS